MTMTIKCPWCGKEFEAENSVVRHSSRVHHKSRRDFDLETKHGGVVPKCKCGCGQDVTYSQHRNAFNTYVHMHQTNDPEIRNKMIEAGRVAANDETVRQKLSQAALAWWRNPDNAEHAKEIVSKWQSALHEGHRRASATPEYRNKLRERMVTNWSGEWGEHQRVVLSSPENRERISAATKVALDDDSIRERLSILASNNQARGVIAANRTKRCWLLNPFTGAEEHFDSGWEVKVLEEAIRRGIPLKRNRDTVIPYVAEDGRRHRYVPDFVTLSGKTIIEVKGRATDRDALKLASAADYCLTNDLRLVVFDAAACLSADDLWNNVS